MVVQTMQAEPLVVQTMQAEPLVVKAVKVLVVVVLTGSGGWLMECGEYAVPGRVCCAWTSMLCLVSLQHCSTQSMGSAVSGQQGVSRGHPPLSHGVSRGHPPLSHGTSDAPASHEQSICSVPCPSACSIPTALPHRWYCPALRPCLLPPHPAPPYHPKALRLSLAHSSPPTQLAWLHALAANGAATTSAHSLPVATRAAPTSGHSGYGIGLWDGMSSSPVAGKSRSPLGR